MSNFAPTCSLPPQLVRSIHEAHRLELERVRARNEEIWPQVQLARLALAELGRVQAFAEHIRLCANKYEMGVNFLKDTPNYDRVVEMQALREALEKVCVWWGEGGAGGAGAGWGTGGR